MKNEQQEILNRLRLLMAYKSEKTLSENYNSIVENYLKEEDNTSPQGNTGGEGFNESADKATLSNAVIVQKMYDDNTLTKEILKKFSCDITNTNFSELVNLFGDVCKQLGVAPASDDIIDYSNGKNTINLVSWLLETQIMGNLTYWITQKSLSENKEKDAISKLIYIKENPRTETKTIQVGYKPDIGKEYGKGKGQVPEYKKVQTTQYDKKIYPSTDPKFNEYLKQLESGERRLDPSDVTLVNDIKTTINKMFKIDEYPSAVRLCTSLGVVRKEDDPEIKRQLEYSIDNNCPTRTLEEENNFREWVNMSFPEIAKELNLSPSTTEFCTSVVKKAAGYPINGNIVDKYDPTK